MKHHIILHEGMSEAESNDKFIFMLRWGIILILIFLAVWFVLSRIYKNLEFTSVALVGSVIFFLAMFFWLIFGGMVTWIAKKLFNKRTGKPYWIGIILIIAGLYFFPNLFSNQQQTQTTQTGHYEINYTAFCINTCNNLERLYNQNSPNKVGNPPYNYVSWGFVDNTYITCICGKNRYNALIKDVEEEFLPK